MSNDGKKDPIERTASKCSIHDIRELGYVTSAHIIATR
jgi:hypothetical protein